MNQRKKKIFSIAQSMPSNVRKNIINLGAEGEKAAVIVFREGKPSRVYRLHKYIKMKEQPKEVQPWKYRKDGRNRQANPLGAVDMGDIFSPLTREHMYE